MNIGVLAREESWHFQDVLRAAAAADCRLSVLSYEDLSSTVSDRGLTFRSNQQDLMELDCVLVRAMPAGSLEQIVFRMDVLERLYQSGVCVVNQPRTIEASVDKYLSLSLLRRAGVPVPRTAVCQTVDEAMRYFNQLGRDVVAKPIFGSLGRGIQRLQGAVAAQSYFEQTVSGDSVVYLQQFVDHGGRDLRLLVIGHNVYTMQRSNDHWITNISCGGTPSPYRASDYEVELARSAATAVGGQLIGVDLVYDAAGNAFVVDVNSSPGWKAMSTTLDRDIAAEVLEMLTRVAAGWRGFDATGLACRRC